MITKISVADYIVKYLARYGIRFTYGVTGGGSASLNNSFAKQKVIQWVATHHEAGAAYAALGEAKLTNKLAVVCPSTGCASTNCVTGVMEAWQDSVPILFLSGNVNRAQMTYLKKINNNIFLRKEGTQEADIISIVSPITKSAIVAYPQTIKKDLKRLIEISMSGRRGPVWLDVPTDVQSALIEVDDEVDYRLPVLSDSRQYYVDSSVIHCIESSLSNAKRPLLLIGQGVRQADAIAQLNRFVARYRIPFVATYGAIDVLPSSQYFIGRVGVKGDRAGNFAVYNCDYLLVIGSSLSTPITGYNLNDFAPNAETICSVDIERLECRVPIDRVVNIQSDAKLFLSSFCSDHHVNQEWIKICQDWRDQWPICLPEYKEEKQGVNIYSFIDSLSKHLPDTAVVASDAGSAFYCCCQGLKLKPGQRHLQSLAQAPMGCALPMAIGAALQGLPVYVVVGDGSFQTNIQELATIRYFNLPIRIFVLNNSGYLSCKATQNKLFGGNMIGNGPDCGLWFPDLGNVASTYEFTYASLDRFDELDREIESLVSAPKPCPTIIEVLCPPDQLIIPTIGASRDPQTGVIKSSPLCQMFPPLSQEELDKNLQVPYTQ